MRTAGDLWPGDFVVARLAGQMFGHKRRVVSIETMGFIEPSTDRGSLLRICFQDGAVTAWENDEAPSEMED